MRKLQRQTRRVNVEQLVIDPNAEPPAEKFYLLSERIADFQKTWDRRQGGKWTQQTYEAKLARYTLQDDWTIQEITNLIIKFRRKHARTMEPSENFYLQIIARERLDLVDLLGATADESRELVSTLVGVRIAKMERYPAEEPRYLLTLGNGKRIELGDSNSFIKQDRFRQVLIDYTTPPHNMDVFRLAEWRQIVSRMLKFIEDLPGSDEATHFGAAALWLTSFIQDYVHAERVVEAQRQAILKRGPGIMEDDVWFSMAGLRKYVKKEFGENPSTGDLGVRLRHLGCQFVDRKSFRTEDGKPLSEPLEGRKGLARPNSQRLRLS